MRISFVRPCPVVISLADTVLGPQSCGMKHFASDPGSVTFSPSDLSCLTTGTLNIIVERGFTKLDSVAPTKFIRLVPGSADEIPVALVP
ncbi:MAG: hypothetical protein JST22_11360 [Bacteroidetes bacterium]|nr:hypothetical protein [Bacteroidota bacterium]